MKKRCLAFLLAFVCLLGMLCGCNNKNKRAVGTCAGYEVLYEELRFVALSIRSELDAEAEVLDAEKLKQRVAKQIAEDYAVFSIAKTYFPELSIQDAEIQDAVEDSVEQAIEAYGRKGAYRSFLKEHFLTENLAKFLLARAEVELKCKEKLEAELFDDTFLESETAFAAWLQNGNLARARRLLFSSFEEAEQAYADLQAGKTPEELVAQNKNINLSTAFYLVRGYSDSRELENAAFALSAKKTVSEVLTNEAGQYLILLFEENDYESFGIYQLPTYFQKMRDERYEAKWASLLTETAQEHPFLWNEFGESIDLVNLK